MPGRRPLHEVSMVAKHFRSMPNTQHDAKRVVRCMRQGADVEERIPHAVHVWSEVYRDDNGASTGNAYDVNAVVQR